jgi:hypothetical protein
MKVILTTSAGSGMSYADAHGIHGTPTSPVKIAHSPRGLDGLCPTEIHVAPGAMEGPDFWDILDVVLVAEKKQPIFATWFWGGKLIQRDDALHRLGVDRPHCVGASESDKHAEKALEFLRTIRPGMSTADATLVAAVAQVYATLALRRS